ncbi:MAG TPA: hypothetical protein VKB66_09065 [Candidatus Acidoferrum sp.]|nr:hypothetical protein [Candidatus Acidoferrum sp.]
MRKTRFLTALTLCSLFPVSLTAQSITPVPIPQPMPIPHPVINISQPLPVEVPLPHVLPVSVGDYDRDLPVQEQETIQKSFSISGAPHKSLEIDNVWGSIEVVGTNSDQVQLTVNKATRAESKDKLEQARKEVTLDITEQQGLLKLYVNGPFRCHCDDGCGHREFEGYVVKMDFQLRVPRDIDIKVKTVNEGRVVVRDINGSFLVRNVNGDVEMSNIAGSGTARTVNGPVKVAFRQNPQEASDFQTINGNVELRFTQGLAADFRFKTFNGSIYSDFPVTALPVRAVQEEHRGAKVVFHADRYTGVRVSSGGPEIKVENLNGDIRILENHE